ncbi:hypothetical protein LCGC14_1395100, partial [marine sediment metagenome]
EKLRPSHVVTGPDGDHYPFDTEREARNFCWDMNHAYQLGADFKIPPDAGPLELNMGLVRIRFLTTKGDPALYGRALLRTHMFEVQAPGIDPRLVKSVEIPKLHYACAAPLSVKIELHAEADVRGLAYDPDPDLRYVDELPPPPSSEMETVTVSPAEKCPRCEGCGKIASTKVGEPWTEWEQLPPESRAGVKTGLVSALPCPACGGTGKMVQPLKETKD